MAETLGLSGMGCRICSRFDLVDAESAAPSLPADAMAGDGALRFRPVGGLD